MTRATDVFIIGGGPAGLATAIAARQQGLDVVVSDGALPPIDKACGEGLMPDTVAALRRLGVALAGEQTHPFRGIRFVSGDERVEGTFPSGCGFGVRRTVLHQLLLTAAQAAGATLLWQTPVTGVNAEGVMLGRQFVRARWIIGADGGPSLVRQWMELDRYRLERSRFAFRRHYRIPPWTDFVELHWGPMCQIYVTPVAADEVGVALISQRSDLRLDDALPAFPNLHSRLRYSQPSSSERGAVTVTRKLRRVYAGRVVLVGDASGGVDAITGEGLGLAFHQAQVLAECLVTGDLARYQREHRRLAVRPSLMARLMLTLDWKASLRDRVMRAFCADPRLFARMLAMHVGELSPASFAAAGFSLGWRTLLA